MKVYLINPPGSFQINERIFPPLGLMYLHEYLVSKGVDMPKIVDLSGKSESEWVIPADGEYYAITATTPQYPVAKKICDFVKKYVGAKVIIGGPHATAMPDECDNDGFDYVAIGEGEYVISRIIAGFYTQGVGFIDNFPHPKMESLPEPYNMKTTFSFRGMTVERNAGFLVSSRGCPYNCNFCGSNSIWHSKVRFHSVPYMRKWIEYWQEKNVNDFYFIDEHIGVTGKRLVEICELMKDTGGYWKCQIRGDALTPEKADLMYASGCRQITIGVESGSQRILDICNKRETVQVNEMAIYYAQQAGIGVKASVIVGLPGEEQEDVDMTAQLLERTRPDEVGIFIFVPYPGTKFFNDGNYTHDWSKYVCVGEDWKTTVFCGEPETVWKRKKQLMDVVGKRFTLDAHKERWKNWKNT